MKNARIVALMFVAVSFMSAASAQDSMHESHSASVSSGPAEQAKSESSSFAETGAKKVGSFFGKLVKGPVSVGKALASGVREGYSQPSPTPQSSAASHGLKPYEPAPAASTVTAPAPSPAEMARRVTQMFARVKGQALAPVEDRSVPATSSSATSAKSASNSKLSTWKESDKTVAAVSNQLF